MASVIASGMLSSFVLALFLPAAALMSVALGQGGGVVFGVIGVAAVVVATAVTARLVSRKPDKLGRFIERIATPAARGPLRRVVQPKAIGAAIVRALSGIDRLARDRGALARASFWAFLNWLMDFGVLVAVAMSIGHGISISALALAFVVGQLVAALPITPGGLGVVEAAVTAALIAQGAPPAAATVTVLAWRLVSHWLPIVIGYIVLPTLGFGQRRVPAVDVPAPVAVA
jgi:uncharacterized protein (TIRG00374 family)